MRSKQQNKKSASSGDSLSTNDSKTEIVLQYEPFGAYVPPLFKSPATKEDFLLQNASSKQHKHMNKMGLTKDQLLEERKDKQRWDFLNRPETPRALVFNFYELEDKAKHKCTKVLKPIKHTSFSLSQAETPGAGFQFKRGYIYALGVNLKVWTPVYLVVDCKLRLIMYYDGPKATKCPNFLLGD